MKIKHLTRLCIASVAALLAGWHVSPANAVETGDDQPLVYHDAESTGFGAGKHIVFLAGDHEYRSEETLPALARILAKRFGFKCTVLFNVNDKGHIEPGNNNMPGMEALDSADLAVVFLRFQDFPDEQMKHFADYIDRGGPVVGLRTATHAFNIPKDKTYAKYSFRYPGDEFEKGFGRQILGETWAGHYGQNHKMSTRHIVLDEAKDHPVMRGVTSPWAQCGGYWTDPMPNSVILTHSQPLVSMEKDADPAPDKEPCPGLWVRTYKSKSGTEGRVMATTSGASEDILDDDFRRMMINGCIWAVGLEDKITADQDISFVGPFNPATYRFKGFRQEVKPQDLAGWDTPIMDSSKTIEPPKAKKPKKRKEGAAPDVSKKKTLTSEPDGEKAPAVLNLKKGDHVCLVGNALGERMQHHNWFETLLHQRYADLNLSVRNLCFPGDEPQERIRSSNFGSPDSHLKHSKADVVLFFFGFNESFDGENGLDQFTADITKLVRDTKAQRYNDASDKSPRIVFVSPIAMEDTGNPDWTDGKEQNTNIELYTDLLKSLCGQLEVGFVDLYRPTKKLFEKSDRQLTLNGAHLNEDGYQALAPILMSALFGVSNNEVSFDDALKSIIEKKNFLWWHRYRAVNGFSIYGGRGTAGKDGDGKFNNRQVMEREREILDQMVANRDQRTWAIARGEKVTEPINDDNTLPFFEPTTNVGGPDDINAKRGKLGTLAYLTAEQQQKKFDLPPGYEINLVASEEQFPELANPVNINFDNKGRLWVATMQSYPHWKPKTKLDDKILILEDDDGDGKADRCKVFADGLHQPTGFEIGDGGAYVAVQPDVLFMKDTDGDDKADVRQRRLVGFDSADTHHGIAGFHWGPGGVLYFQEGLFKYSQIESPYGLNRLANAGIWKYNSRTEEFGVHVTYPFANPWGHIFDRWGQDFIGDASGGNSYWGTPISGHIEYPQKHARGFQKLYKKRTRPLAGCEIVSSSHFPDDVQGNWLVTNCIGDRAVLSHKIEDQGAGFWGTEVPAMVSSRDGNFRPVDVEIAPDGSLYIVDWHNALIGHLQHNLRDPSRDHSHGRIWRVTYPERPLVKPAKIDGQPISVLLDHLKLYEDRTRNRVKRELAQRDSADVIAELDKWVSNLDPSDPEIEHHVLEALWVHQMHNRVNEELLDRVLSSKDHRARAAAVRVISFWVNKLPEPLQRLKKFVADPHPRVRLEAVRAISFLSGDDAFEAALDVLDHEPDYFIKYTLEETLRSLEQ